MLYIWLFYGKSSNKKKLLHENVGNQALIIKRPNPTAVTWPQASYTWYWVHYNHSTNN